MSYSYNYRHMYYRRDGAPYIGKDAHLQWAKDFAGERHVGDTVLPNGIRVSTVWLGLDHGLFERRPKIFESMVFAPEKIVKMWLGKKVALHADLEMIRYSAEDEAKLGHKMLCKKWKSFKTAAEVLCGRERRNGDE